MQFADLTDTNFTFTCGHASDACEYWDYDLSIKRGDEKYLRSISCTEIAQLRENCKKILEATVDCQGGL